MISLLTPLKQQKYFWGNPRWGYLQHSRSRFYIARVIAYFVSNFVAVAEL